MPIQNLSSEIESFLTPESPGREGQETGRAGQRKATKPIQYFDKRRGRSLLRLAERQGGGTPRALLNTLWWLLTRHFGLQGRQEHHQMKVEDFTLQSEDRGNEFLTFSEGPTQARQRRLSMKTRLVTQKCLPLGTRKGVPS